METTNLHLAWAWILVGMIAGAVMGLFFHRDDWLGGFDAWPRRMVRLAHISFLGTGMLNLAYALSAPAMTPADEHEAVRRAVSTLFIVGAATMPTVCLLAAWRKPLRHLFVIPAASLIAATAIFLARALTA